MLASFASSSYGWDLHNSRDLELSPVWDEHMLRLSWCWFRGRRDVRRLETLCTKARQGFSRCGGLGTCERPVSKTWDGTSGTAGVRLSTEIYASAYASHAEALLADNKMYPTTQPKRMDAGKLPVNIFQGEDEEDDARTCQREGALRPPRHRNTATI